MVRRKVKLRELARVAHRMRNLRLHDAEPGQSPPPFECRPILVNTSSPDEKGCLVLAEGRLVAVLVRVADSGAGQDRTELPCWHMEAGFGRCAVAVPPLFDTLAEAVAWMRVQLSAR
jgi:hypothetical protein